MTTFPLWRSTIVLMLPVSAIGCGNGDGASACGETAVEQFHATQPLTSSALLVTLDDGRRHFRWDVVVPNVCALEPASVAFNSTTTSLEANGSPVTIDGIVYWFFVFERRVSMTSANGGASTKQWTGTLDDIDINTVDWESDPPALSMQTDLSFPTTGDAEEDLAIANGLVSQISMAATYRRYQVR